MTIEPAVMTRATDEVMARQAASEYLHTNLGAQYRLEQGFYADRPPRPVWRFLVINDEYKAVTGYVDVDAETGKVIPLDAEQRQEVRERAVVIAAKHQKALPRDEQGYILPFLAKTRVNGYLANAVVFLAGAYGQPAFVDGDPPVWRVAAALRLHEHGKVIDLGVIHVNARTGEVIPLTDQQIQHMQRCAADVAATLQCSATAAG
jgi:hypothetical protein